MKTETSEQLFEKIVRGTDASVAVEALIARGTDALPALCSAIEEGRAFTTARTLLGWLDVTDRVEMLISLATDPRQSVRSAAIDQLGRTGDLRAVDAIMQAAAGDTYPADCIRALGDFGSPVARAPLRSIITRSLGDVARPERLSELCEIATREGDPSELNLAAWGGHALAKLGDFSLTEVAATLARLRPSGDLATEAVLIRLRAIAALDVSVGPGIAAVLADCVSDPDGEVADAAVRAQLHLGRIRAADQWLNMFDPEDGDLVPSARRALSELTGRQPPKDANEARAWWTKRSKRYDPDVCYRFGVPASPVRLVVDAHRPDSAIARIELQQMLGLPFLESTLSPPPAAELAALDAWWHEHAGDFPFGKLHRWGRTYEPDACD